VELHLTSCSNEKKSVLRKPIPPATEKGFWWWLMLETVKAALAAAARHWIS
jgi:hypothetical protein